MKVYTNKAIPSQLKFTEQGFKIMSYNVAGWNAARKKGLDRYLEAEDADIVCLQETKLNDKPMNIYKQYPHQYWSNCSVKKGYSGTCILSKVKPLSVEYGVGDQMDKEGRYILLEFDDYILIACYVPNAGNGLVRLQEKREHYKVLVNKFKSLQKPLIWAGDLNVAHHEIDLARPKTNLKTAGFTPEERKDFGDLLEQCRLVDAYRHFKPTEEEYTYFSFRFGCREKHIGWRLDYFCVAKDLMVRVKDCIIRSEIYGASDHVPIVLLLD